MSLILRQRRTQQPQQAGVDRGHPALHAPLLFFHHFGNGLFAPDLSGNGRNLSERYVPTLEVSNGLRGARLDDPINGEALNISQGSGVVIPANTPFTMFAYAARAGGTDGRLLNLRDSSGTPICAIGIGGNGVSGSGSQRASSLIRDDAGTLVSMYDGAAPQVDTKPHLYVIRRSASGVVSTAFDNYALSGGSAAGSFTFEPLYQAYGWDPANSSLGFWDGTVYYGGLVLQEWSDAQIRSIVENPWQLFEPQPRRIYALAAEGGGAVTGSLAATETGSDSAAFAGSVLVQGLLAAAEAGGDTAAIAAQVRVQGTLSATEAGSDTGAVVGQVLVQAALAGAEVGSDTAAIAGTVLVQGALAATEIGSDTAVINGGNATIGTLAATETGPDTAAIAGAVIVQAAAAATESGSDSASITGAALVRGLLAAVEGGPDASAIVGQILVSGLLSASESGSDTAAINAIRRVRRPLFAQGMSVFFNADEFACEASLGGNDGTVIFDEAGLLLEGMGIQTVEPTALCPSEQWPAASDGQTITIHMPNGSRNFIVRSVAPIDDGMLKLLTLARL